MKKFTLPAIIIIAFSACTMSQKKAETKTFEKGVTEIITTYPNTSDAIAISYNENNQIIKTASTETNFINYTYNDEGLPIKAEFYFDNILDHYKTIEWFTDSMHITNSLLSETSTIEDARETYVYNENKEMVQIIQYKKDSLGLWQAKGAKLEFEWANGNLMKIKCLVPKEYIYDDSTLLEQENNDKSLIELTEISDKIIKDGYTLFYESTYTYDDKNNPYQNSSLAQLILPSKNNISKNNPLTISKIYTTGERIDFSLSYEYSEKGFPTLSNVLVQSNVDGFEKAQFAREFKY